MTQLAQAPATPLKPLKLTRRGRNLLIRLPLALVFLAVVIGFCAMLIQPAQAGTVSQDDGLGTVTVMQGETLWEIADMVAPERDTRDVVQEIRDLNTLEGPLQAGDSLVVPAAE